jgi:glycerophosphoryl diester phosphodiesterase
MIFRIKALIFVPLFLFLNSITSAQNSLIITKTSTEARKETHNFRVSAHRGNSEIAPENTLASFRKILEISVEYIEIDVRTTKDGQLVILHDGTLDRTTTGKGRMKDYTLAELQTLSTGIGHGEEFKNEKIPTLEETLSLISNWNSIHKLETNIYVDCKDVLVESILKALKKYKLLKNALFYGPDDYLLALKKANKHVKVMPSLSYPKEISIKIKALKPYAFDVNWEIVSRDLVIAIHKEKIKVFADLLGLYDNSLNYIKAIEYQVDVIQTDHVDSVYKTLLSQKTQKTILR